MYFWIAIILDHVEAIYIQFKYYNKMSIIFFVACVYEQNIVLLYVLIIVVVAPAL